MYVIWWQIPKFPEKSYTCHLVDCRCQHRIGPTLISFAPTRSPHAESRLCDTGRQAAREASDTQEEAHRLGKRWYYRGDEFLHGRIATHDIRSMPSHSDKNKFRSRPDGKSPPDERCNNAPLLCGA